MEKKINRRHTYQTHYMRLNRNFKELTENQQRRLTDRIKLSTDHAGTLSKAFRIKYHEVAKLIHEYRVVPKKIVFDPIYPKAHSIKSRWSNEQLKWWFDTMYDDADPTRRCCDCKKPFEHNLGHVSRCNSCWKTRFKKTKDARFWRSIETHGSKPVNGQKRNFVGTLS